MVLTVVSLIPPSNEVWGKVIFSQMSVILSTGGSLSRGSLLSRVSVRGVSVTETPLVTVEERAICILLKFILVNIFTPAAFHTVLYTEFFSSDGPVVHIYCTHLNSALSK